MASANFWARSSRSAFRLQGSQFGQDIGLHPLRAEHRHREAALGAVAAGICRLGQDGRHPNREDAAGGRDDHQAYRRARVGGRDAVSGDGSLSSWNSSTLGAGAGERGRRNVRDSESARAESGIAEGSPAR